MKLFDELLRKLSLSEDHVAFIGFLGLTVLMLAAYVSFLAEKLVIFSDVADALLLNALLVLSIMATVSAFKNLAEKSEREEKAKNENEKRSQPSYIRSSIRENDNNIWVRPSDEVESSDFHVSSLYGRRYSGSNSKDDSRCRRK